jgi:hypothetical protein
VILTGENRVQMSVNIPKLTAAISYFAEDDAIGKVKLFNLLF